MFGVGRPQWTFHLQTVEVLSVQLVRPLSILAI